MQNIRYTIIHLSSIIIFSYSCAFTVTGVIRKSFSPSSSPLVREQSGGLETAAPRRPIDVNAIINSNFFKIAPQDVQGVPAAAANIDDIILLGTIAGDFKFARALIKNKSETGSKVYLIGDIVSGKKIVRIEPTEVFLKADGRTFRLALAGKNSSGNEIPGGFIEKIPAGAPSLPPNGFSRPEMKKALKINPAEFLRGVNAEVLRNNGQIDGYKLTTLSDDSFFYTIGARSGDIIKSVNGLPINSNEAVSKMWESFSDRQGLSIEIERNGQRTRIGSNPK